MPDRPQPAPPEGAASELLKPAACHVARPLPSPPEVMSLAACFVRLSVARAYRIPLVVALILSVDVQAQAQATSQFWPESSVFVKLSDRTRVSFLSTTVKEDGDSTSGEFGPNVDIYLHAIAKRKHWAGFRLDESKNRTLMVRIGYRYMPTYGSDDPSENRALVEATARYPLVRGMLVSNRNRLDSRVIDGDYSWRYRNRLSFERELSLGPVRLNPYARGEVFYDSRVDEWSRTEFMAGASFPAGRWEFEGYFDYQHDTGGSSNRTVRAIGGVVNLYLR
jgi:hypothetical protein